MIDRPYCKKHYSECICSRCRYDKDNCCGRQSFLTYMCPFGRCSEFREKPVKRGSDNDGKTVPEPSDSA